MSKARSKQERLAERLTKAAVALNQVAEQAAELMLSAQDASRALLRAAEALEEA